MSLIFPNRCVCFHRFGLCFLRRTRSFFLKRKQHAHKYKTPSHDWLRYFYGIAAVWVTASLPLPFTQHLSFRAPDSWLAPLACAGGSPVSPGSIHSPHSHRRHSSKRSSDHDSFFLKISQWFFIIFRINIRFLSLAHGVLSFSHCLHGQSRVLP